MSVGKETSFKEFSRLRLDRFLILDTNLRSVSNSLKSNYHLFLTHIIPSLSGKRIFSTLSSFWIF
jgi:hypothetical protein